MKQLRITNKLLYGKKIVLMHDGEVQLDATGAVSVSEECFNAHVGKGGWVDGSGSKDSGPANTKKSAPVKKTEKPVAVNEEDAKAQKQAWRVTLAQSPIEDLYKLAEDMRLDNPRQFSNKLQLIKYIVDNS